MVFFNQFYFMLFNANWTQMMIQSKGAVALITNIAVENEIEDKERVFDLM